MNNASTQLQSDVMRRVRTVHTLRRYINRTTLKAAVCLTSCYTVIMLVSISHVVANMTHISGLAADAAYIMAAFVHTTLLVQGGIVLAVAVGVWLVIDIVQNVRESATTKKGGFLSWRPWAAGSV